MTHEPTPRQRQVLRLVLDSLEGRGYPPTIRDLMAALNIRSTNGVQYHLRALEDKGLLVSVEGIARGLRLTDAGMQALGHHALISAAIHHERRAERLRRLARDAPRLAGEGVAA